MAEERRARHSLSRRITLSTLLIFLTSIWALSYYASRMLREDMERMLADQQSSTVSYVADELNHELGERILAVEKLRAQLIRLCWTIRRRCSNSSKGVRFSRTCL